MPRDILSRSGEGPQQQSQPALLPDKKGRQRILEGGAALGKLDFHAHAAHAKAVRIDGPFHKPGQPLLPGEGAVKGHTAHVSQRIRAHRADVHAFHLFQLLCGQFHGKTSFCVLGWWGNAKGQHSEKCCPLACPYLGTNCLELNRGCPENAPRPLPAPDSRTLHRARPPRAGCPRQKSRSFPSHRWHSPGTRCCSTAGPAEQPERGRIP